MTLGFPEHLTKWELSDAYREAYLQEQRIVPHVIVDDGPVLENVMMGDDVDVTKFPAPKWHEKDGGRYIGTGTYSITRDPEEDWLNAGAYRAQVHDKKTGRHRDGRGPSRTHPPRQVLQARRAAAGGHGSGRRSDRFLLRRAGGALRRVRARPRRRPARPAGRRWCAARSPAFPSPPMPRSCSKATSRRIALHAEGPFGEWTGHYAGGVRDIPVLDIKAIYHRNDPIVLGVPPMGGDRTRWRATAR